MGIEREDKREKEDMEGRRGSGEEGRVRERKLNHRKRDHKLVCV